VTGAIKSWQSVQREVLRRIHAREWRPGAQIPNEADLATEFGCARATVNRALRNLADAGLLDRRRKAGTRVALQPVAKATLDIPVIRLEVEGRGQVYGYRLMASEQVPPPPDIANAMNIAVGDRALHLIALHMADDARYALEDRWINLGVVPSAAKAPFAGISGNEWLLANAPYTHGEIGFSAVMADAQAIAALACPDPSALFVLDRLTWDQARVVTKVRITYAPGHAMTTAL
jgi:GntR family transcriptional regulator, histidine utilization repressor